LSIVHSTPLSLKPQLFPLTLPSKPGLFNRQPQGWMWPQPTFM